MGAGNTQDLATWEHEAAAIATSVRRLVWHQPSRHEGLTPLADTPEGIFVGADAFAEQVPVADQRTTIQGGRERGVTLHKLLEEVLTGETIDSVQALTTRAQTLLAQLGLVDQQDAAIGPSSGELAMAVRRTLQLPEIAALRPRLHPEMWVYAAVESDKTYSLTAGITDAVALDNDGQVEVVVDWKSDVQPGPDEVELYRDQVREYLGATGARLGLIVFVTSNRIERIERPV
jgi:exodeoxyribonuclease-5